MNRKENEEKSNKQQQRHKNQYLGTIKIIVEASLFFVNLREEKWDRRIHCSVVCL